MLPAKSWPFCLNLVMLNALPYWCWYQNSPVKLGQYMISKSDGMAPCVARSSAVTLWIIHLLIFPQMGKKELQCFHEKYRSLWCNVRKICEMDGQKMGLNMRSWSTQFQGRF